MKTFLALLCFALYANVALGQSYRQQVSYQFDESDGLPSANAYAVENRPGGIVVFTERGAARRNGDSWTALDPSHVPAVHHPVGLDAERSGVVRDHARGPQGCPQLVAAERGAFLLSCGSADWQRLLPVDGVHSWALADARAVGVSETGDLWIAAPQGVAHRQGETWRLHDGGDGLPWADFTSLAIGASGDVWFGTHFGAVRFDGSDWEYRQGRRWLPDDDVLDVAIDDRGDAWFATPGGVARISEQATTLADKARFFEEEIDRYHRRTEWEYVDWVRLEQPGDRSSFEQRDSDNDGLWTGMYGAGQCFAYAATGRPEFKDRATRAFRALAFLSEVTQGGSHPAPPGFPARTILPTSGPDPNVGRAEADRRKRAEGDRMWKLIEPRWPVSADGRWYWKTDTSSDELDGHYFLYAAYHDHVAETEAERDAVRAVVRRVTDHLIDHGFALVDHDGERTRWAVFGPEQLNHDPRWYGERGLNSLSILSYLRVAAHVTGDPKYDQAARRLLDEHAYAANIREPKVQNGPGTGNESDDEMAFMAFYDLLRYERDESLRKLWLHSFHRYWQRETPERNPLFHYLYAGSVRRGEVFEGTFDRIDLEPDAGSLADALDTLRRYPFDRVNWGSTNAHRLDLVELPGSPGRGTRRDHKVLPIDERFVEHWNHDPWRFDYPGDGRRIADGASFLLPYYLGLYLDLLPVE